MGKSDHRYLPEMGDAGIDGNPVGLTGGIGSGKSAACDRFQSLGIAIADADIIARALVEPGTLALQEIVELFGQEVLDSSLALDRGAVRRLVFANPDKRRQLEGILHPRIYPEMLKQLQGHARPYCLLSIPLLVETGNLSRFSRIIVVDTPIDIQIERVMARDNLTAAEVEAIMGTQASREQRLAAADDVIHNDADLGHLHKQVDALHQRYLQLFDPDR